MTKNKILGLFIFFFLTTTVFSITLLLKQTQFLGKFAEEKTTVAVYGIIPQGKINRIWPNFSQGGEEQKPMLEPASPLIQALQPRYVRIDHLFDFPNLDLRVNEIIKAGANPFLALSYFPPPISGDLTTFPSDLTGWQALVQKTIQQYSGKNQKNLLGVYYEVWNEPDLFGKMTPEQYFSLYRASVLAAENCQNCNSFKIGGPAITTLKKDWIETFLRRAGESKTRLDFISWHSYQLNPGKTLTEVNNLKNLASFKNHFADTELIISEWGSVPEMSELHDSYFDASHTIVAIEKLKDSLNKLFTFELVDGPSPEGKEFWGRWGLITNQIYGLTPKPRYYSFAYLNKLLELEIKPQEPLSGVTVIGSTDGKENYCFVLSREKEKPSNFEIGLKDPLPGIYQINSYFLGPSREPFIPESKTISVNNNLSTNIDLAANAVVLLEINRASPALVIAKGATDLPQDSSAKLTINTPPLIFLLNQPAVSQAEFSFLFKPNWNTLEKQKHIFLESKNPVGDGISAWYENSDSPKIISSFVNYGETVEQVVLPIEFLDRNTWHNLSFSFDNNLKQMKVVFNGKESITKTTSNIKLGDFILIGGSRRENNSVEGFIDNLSITTNQEILYQKNFD
ncbi:hypothetical protein COS55_00395 [Candidatus Shapirobacteria bacterium CG03_land_8_20_14_0_80_40_19]|uniref:Glycosyl hydrolases family 39 N-terminal catalytic domain-containing protein n=3 Tax=Candidatus Shapironibacteriota TaxID=1752721 RepID=A0A2M7BFY9_9BACT|nr:MAG: hypothetical protein COS55_00395 [Candidatus Shapirobacteria bacterium CG03_land_8_20_14_0_80_40_19]PJC29262.1 MAG: hypothetical protein CO053_00040 [Candidatus Shapirobacteria bacterium CG_4_9_14_0_2_um_filter_40_11]PJC76195.1 MAG: hypothetical protein CO010_03215 [Candidatus Shapirobacteria bacterium CG_4_8_14_3_um_filter_39_11]